MNSSPAVPSSKPPKNTLWLQTYHFTITQNLLSTRPGDVFYISSFDLRFLEEKFSIYLTQLTPDSMTVYCSRRHPNPEAVPDDGYFLRFQFSIIGFSEESSKTAEMHCGQDFTYATFDLSALHIEFCKRNYSRYIFDLKVVAKMIELENLQIERRYLREVALCKAKERFTVEAVENLSSLLKRPGVEDVFTGRLNKNCARVKMNIIVRASRCSEQIVKYLAAIGTGVSKTKEFSELMNYLLKGDRDPISNEDAVVAYLVSQGAGLDFFKELITDYLIGKLEDENIVLDVIQAADHVEDQALFEKAVTYFLKYFEDIEQSESLKEICDNAR